MATRKWALCGAITAATLLGSGCGGGSDAVDGAGAPTPTPTTTPTPSPSPTPTPAPIALTVVKAGAGTGTVTSTPAGIDCGATCSTSLSFGTSVVITAAPALGSSFDGWSGDCSGQSPNVTIAMTAARNCVATFSIAPVTGAGTSDECLDPGASTAGHRVVKVYRLAGSTYETVQEVIGPTVRNGEPVIETRERTTYTAGPVTGQTADVTSFGRQDGADFRTFSMLTASITSGVTTRIDYELSPYMLFPGGLTPGQSRTHSYARITSVDGATPQTVQITDTYRFNGFETVTVPAGTFNRACSWTATQNGFVVNFWLARGSGIPLRSQGGFELLSATINGVAVAP